jgi:hypothetical protein
LTPARRHVVAVALLALLGVLVARALARVCLDDVPHVMDEIAYDLQAKTFGAGAVSLPVRLPRASFALWFVEDRSALFGIFPPGWPAAWAAFRAVGLGAWANPLLHGVAALATAAAVRRLAGRGASVLAALVYAFVAAGAAVVLWTGVVIASGRARAAHLLGAGLGLGVVVVTRPLCAVAVAALLAALVGVALRRGTTPPARLALVLVPVALAVLALGAYNLALTGSATRFPQTMYFDEHIPPLDTPFYHYRPGCNGLGLGHGCDDGIRGGRHDVLNMVSNTGDNLYAWLLLAGGGPLVFAAATLGVWRGRRRLAASLAVVPAGAVALYSLYWYAGTCYGARFYHAALPATLGLAAIGLAWTRSRFGPRALAAALALWLGWNAFAGAQAAREIRGEGGDYWGTDARFVKLARGWREKDALVLVAFRSKVPPRFPTFRWTSFIEQTYFSNNVRATSAVAANDARMQGRVVFGKYHPALVPELRERFAGRELWLYVIEDDPARGWDGDTLVRMSETPLAEIGADLPRPKDNFDGFVFGAIVPER